MHAYLVCLKQNSQRFYRFIHLLLSFFFVSVLFQVNLKGWNKMKTIAEIYETKIKSLNEAMRKKDEKIKNQAKHITEQQGLKNKLNIANKTVHDLMEEIERLRVYGIESVCNTYEMYESQMKVAESEIDRLNVIINFLYMRGRE